MPEQGLTVVTPWLGHPEFCTDYERAVQGARVIVVDNGSGLDDYQAIAAMVHRLDGHIVTNPVNRWFSAACNQGLALARTDAVLMLNNDVSAEPGFVERVYADIMADPDSLHGPSLRPRVVDGVRLDYLEGWCIGASRRVWHALGGFDATTYPLPYWEDNDLCLRAVVAGYGLETHDWPIQHTLSGTTRTMPTALAGSSANQRTFEERARNAFGSLRLVAAGG